MTGVRNNPPVRSVPSSQLAVIGWATFGMGVGTITGLKMGGCIVGVTSPGSTFANIAMWPPPSLFSVVGMCDGNNTNGYLTIATGVGAALTSSGFRIQPVGLAPKTGYNAAHVFIAILGPSNFAGRLRPQNRANGLPVAPYGVTGATSFSMAGAVISRAKYMGCIRSVVRPPTAGLVNVNMWPPQPNPTLASSACSDLSNASYWGTGNITNSSIQFLCVGVGGPANRDTGLATITTLGPSPPGYTRDQAFSTSRGAWGVVGIAKYNVIANVVSNVRTAGCVMKVTAVGAQNGADIWLAPAQKNSFYSWMAIAPGINAAFCTLSGVVTDPTSQGPQKIEVVPVGVSPVTSNPDTTDLMVTVFGPVGPWS